jgi:hypothetical protein
VNYVAMEMAGVVAAMQHVRDRLHRLTRFGIPAVMGFSMACTNRRPPPHGAHRARVWPRQKDRLPSWLS